MFSGDAEIKQNNEMKDFENRRNKILEQEIDIQKKTFTKWCNSYLSESGMEISNLVKDLEDGKRLIKLLEAISGAVFGKPNQGRLKIQKIENVNKVLHFLQTKVHLESITAEDIVDGNQTLVLGLVWTIILRFQIQDIEVDVDETKEKKRAKEALLLWCQRRTAGYPGVNVNDFTGSWQSGLAFNALLHSQKPDLFNFNQLNPSDHVNNLNHAFNTAQNAFGIAKLLDAEDVDVIKPDEKSILIYVSAYYHTFAQRKNEDAAGNQGIVELEPEVINNVTGETVIELPENCFTNIKRHEPCQCCFETYDQIVKLSCDCVLCVECFKSGYKVAIDSISCNFSCIMCLEPKLYEKDNFAKHLDLLTQKINSIMDLETRNKYNNYLTEQSLKKDENFIWCQHGCNSGGLVDPSNSYLKCDICRKRTCVDCKQAWEPHHEGRTCKEHEEFQFTIGETQIVCPKCQTKFCLAKGGCLHYTCRCTYQFCGSCKTQYSEKKMDSCQLYKCEFDKLHGHHPYNCFYYLRDFKVTDLAQLLNEEKKDLKLQKQKLKKCQLIVTNQHDMNVECGSQVYAVNGETYGLCEKHLKVHIHHRIIDENLDPIHLYDIKILELIIERHKQIVPFIPTDLNRKFELIKFVNRHIPKTDLKGNFF